MIQLQIRQEGLEHNIKRAREHGVILPTIAQMQHPETIPEKIRDRAGCGLDGGAVVSALFAREDTAQAARQMRALAEQIAR